MLDTLEKMSRVETNCMDEQIDPVLRREQTSLLNVVFERQPGHLERRKIDHPKRVGTLPKHILRIELDFHRPPSSRGQESIAKLLEDTVGYPDVRIAQGRYIGPIVESALVIDQGE